MVIISVSLTERQRNFLKDTKISASALLHIAIEQKIEESGYNFETNQQLKKRIESLAKLNMDYREHMEQKGVLDDFISKKINS